MTKKKTIQKEPVKLREKKLANGNVTSEWHHETDNKIIIIAVRKNMQPTA